MEQCIYKRKTDGIYIRNLEKTWEKFLLVACATVAIEKPADVSAMSSRSTRQQAVLKFAAVLGATPTADRFPPGTFINQTQAALRELGVPVATDCRAARQPLSDVSCVNIPPIFLSNTLSMPYERAILGNKQAHSWPKHWMLGREALRMRGPFSHEHPRLVPRDLCFHGDPEEAEKQGQAAAGRALTREEFRAGCTALTSRFTAAQPEVAGWFEGTGARCASSVVPRSSPPKTPVLSCP